MTVSNGEPLRGIDGLVAPIVVASSRRFGEKSAATIVSTPRCPQRSDDRDADRPAAEHQCGLAGLDGGLVDGMQPDGHRLGQRGVPRVEPVGNA